jgi:hypothetical protein
MHAVDACQDELHFGFISSLQPFQSFAELGVLHKNNESGVADVSTLVGLKKNIHFSKIAYVRCKAKFFIKLKKNVM